MTHKKPQPKAKTAAKKSEPPTRKPAAKFVPASEVSPENLTAEAHLGATKNSSDTEKTPCTDEPSTVSSTQVGATGIATEAVAPESNTTASDNGQTGDRIMELTFKRSDKQRKSISVVYTADGYPGSVRFSKTLFADKNAPASVTVNSDAFAGPRAKLTPEERKARLKARPKLTDAQKLQKIEERAARLREKLAKGTADKSAAA